MTTTAPTVDLPAQRSATPAADYSEVLDLLPIRLRLPSAVVSAGADAWEKWFVEFTLANDDTPWQMELTADGMLEIMPPTYPPSDEHEGETFGELRQWNIINGRPGTATGPTGAYRLANGAIRCPDAAWTPAEKVLPPSAEPPRARPYCPDFVIEVRSGSQRSLTPLLGKMREYMENGAQLGWLIDPLERTVRVYRAGFDEPELLADPEALDGEEILPGFTFAVRELIFELA